MPRYALITGITQYDNFRNLPKAASDASAIATILAQYGNYQIQPLPRQLIAAENRWELATNKKLTCKELGQTLRTFLLEQAKGQEALIYFAGHGFETTSITGDPEGYLASSDSASDGRNAIQFDDLNKLIRRSSLSSLVVLLDCCHAGSFLERSLLDSALTAFREKQDYYLITACRSFERAREEEEHGVFTAAVLEGLQQENADENGQVSGDLLFDFLARDLSQSGQEPIRMGMGRSINLVTYPPKAPTTSRTLLKSAKVFISYRSQEPDLSVAQEFYEALKASGHEVFMAAESIQLGTNWSQAIDRELEQCDYFLLLLSPQSAMSEMVTEEVRRAKELRDTRQTAKPVMLPIRVNFPMSSPLNYDLRGYLNRIQQREWESTEDTPKILQEVLSILGEGQIPELTTPPKNSALAEVLIDRIDQPPIPVAEPELPEGQVDLASLFYVERSPIEAKCYEEIARPGALICIKAPRQMGKTSLMSRILKQAEDLGYLTVPLSFQLARSSIFTDLDKLLQWFCAGIGRRLQLPNRVTEYWDETYDGMETCTAYFDEYLLAQISKPLVLGLDEVDRVFQHREIASDFLGLLRAWHEQAKISNLWKNLRLVLVHSTEVYIPMDINQSPFNVGLRIKLPEFTPEQVQELAQRHGLDWNLNQVNQLRNMVGGHPYLVRLALYYIARQELTLKQLLQSAPTESGLYGDHLRRHLWNLEQRPELAVIAKKVMTTDKPVRIESIQAFQLHSMGIVNLQGNDVSPRCNLYRQYFSECLNSRN